VSDHQTILFEHVAATLPDSISGQKKILAALKHVLTRNHPARSHVTAQLSMLEAYEKFQAELPFKFSHPGKAPRDKGNDGRETSLPPHGKDGQ